MVVSGQGRPHVYRAVKQPTDQGPLTALSEGETGLLAGNIVISRLSHKTYKECHDHHHNFRCLGELFLVSVFLFGQRALEVRISSQNIPTDFLHKTDLVLTHSSTDR